jgi:hypothetical protein
MCLFYPHINHFIHNLWLMSMSRPTCMSHKQLEQVGDLLLAQLVIHFPIIGYVVLAFHNIITFYALIDNTRQSVFFG